MTQESTSAAPESIDVRIDVWLWAARFFKTRSLAKQAIDNGRIEIDGDRVKPARIVRCGQSVRIRRGEVTLTVTVLALSERRGDAKKAATLYRETEASIAERAASAQNRAVDRASYSPPPVKPSKKDRRSLKNLLDYHGPG